MHTYLKTKHSGADSRSYCSSLVSGCPKSALQQQNRCCAVMHIDGARTLLLLLCLTFILLLSPSGVKAENHARQSLETNATETGATDIGQDKLGSASQPVSPAMQNNAYAALPDFDSGATARISKQEPLNVEGGQVPSRQVVGLQNGVIIPDGQGGVLTHSTPLPAANPALASARELKLKVRELADQLLTGVNPQAMQGMTALPLSFVNQDNFEETSSLGRYLGEALFYEFNQRGFPVREYRSENEISTRQGEGEFYLSRRQQRVYTDSPLSLLVAGTYYYDKQNVFINARLVRAADGMVMRTASLVFAQTEVSRRMLANSGRRLEATYVGMQDYQTMTRATDLTGFDLGEDIH